MFEPTVSGKENLKTSVVHNEHGPILAWGPNCTASPSFSQRICPEALDTGPIYSCDPSILAGAQCTPSSPAQHAAAGCRFASKILTSSAPTRKPLPDMESSNTGLPILENFPFLEILPTESDYLHIW